MNPDHQKTEEKRGRPKIMISEREDQEKCETIISIQKAILHYLSNIGLPKGIVFRSEERKNLIAEGLLKWNQHPEWDNYKELEKCRSMLEKKFKLKKGVRNLKLSELVEIVTQICDVFCEEATEQVYEIFGKILASISNKCEVDNRQMWEKLTFLNRKFTSKKLKYYIIDDYTDQEMFEQFEILLGALRVNMEAICESPDEWRTYQEYEKNLDEELKEIEKSGQ